jgi:hypothetical protein
MYKHPPYRGRGVKIPLPLFTQMHRGKKRVGFCALKGTWAEMASAGIFGERVQAGLRTWVRAVKQVQAKYPDLQPVSVE